MKVILYMAITANGMIARKDGDSNWVSEEDNKSFTAYEAGLVGEIYLDVEPLVFAEGIPLFAPADLPAGKAGFEYKLKLLEVKKLSDQTIQLHYKVIKNG